MTLRPPTRPLLREPRLPPKEVSMTVVLGFPCADGVVICADSQTTISGYTKGHVHKIHPHITVENSAIVFSGAGTSIYIDNAIRDCGRGNKTGSLDEISQELEEQLLAFFNKRIAPWAYFPERERPDADLMIGIGVKDGTTGLFQYSGTSFVRLQASACIGAGVILANNLLDRLSGPSPTVDEAICVGAYVLSQVKRGVETCGGFSSIVALRGNGDITWIDSEDLENADRQFRRIEKRRDSLLRKELVKLKFKIGMGLNYKKHFREYLYPVSKEEQERWRELDKQNGIPPDKFPAPTRKKGPIKAQINVVAVKKEKRPD
jgi:20S proteasome alpha/beta subunit